MADSATDSGTLQEIQIGNLSAGATEVQLRALFLTHGPIASYQRPIDAHTERPGAVVYVEMAPADATAAIKALNGHRLGDKAISVQIATPLASWAPNAARGPRSPLPRRTVTAASRPGDVEDTSPRA